ncbi:hypothetical protein GCM10010303_80310 [Streptomyces purpurascens]|nr:hypothetical protein GCM10010303_80310 [Streptomyces purpurascens]
MFTEPLLPIKEAENGCAGPCGRPGCLRHWNAGANPSDGCNTGAEVLISEAVAPLWSALTAV